MENSTDWKVFEDAESWIYGCEFCNVTLTSHQLQTHVASHQHYQNTINSAQFNSESKPKVGFEQSSIKSEEPKQFQCDLQSSVINSDSSCTKNSGQSGQNDQQFLPKYDNSVQIPVPEFSDKTIKAPQPQQFLPVIDLTCESDDENENSSNSPPKSTMATTTATTATVTSPLQTKSEYQPHFYNQSDQYQCQSQSQPNSISRFDYTYFGGTVIENQFKIQSQAQNHTDYKKEKESVQNSHERQSSKLIQNSSNFHPHFSPPLQFQNKVENNPQIQTNDSNSFTYSHLNLNSNLNSAQPNFNNPYQNIENYRDENKSSGHFESAAHANPQNQNQIQNQIPVIQTTKSNLPRQMNPEKMGVETPVEENVVQNQNQHFGGKILNPSPNPIQKLLLLESEMEKEVRVDIRVKFREERLRVEKEWRRKREELKIGRVRKKLQKELQRQQQHQGFHIFQPNPNPNLNASPQMNPKDTFSPVQPSTSASVPAPSIPTLPKNKPAPLLLTCKFCPETFKSGTDLLRHEIYYHKMDPVDPKKFCKICGKRYATASGIYTHMKKFHQSVRKKSQGCKMSNVKYTCNF